MSRRRVFLLNTETLVVSSMSTAVPKAKVDTEGEGGAGGGEGFGVERP